MRVLLDENFPAPRGFDPADLDAHLDVTTLVDHDPALVGNRTPDWYLYLVAHEAGFDALVTRDWHQSAQTEEMWVITRTDLSVITWKKPQDDPVVEWAQILAYMPQLRGLREKCGPSVFFLPAPSLEERHHVLRTADRLGELASEQGRAKQELMNEARANAVEWLDERDLVPKHAQTLGL